MPTTLESRLSAALIELSALVEKSRTDSDGTSVPLVLAEISLETTIHNLRLYLRRQEEGP